MYYFNQNSDFQDALTFIKVVMTFLSSLQSNGNCPAQRQGCLVVLWQFCHIQRSGQNLLKPTSMNNTSAVSWQCIGAGGGVGTSRFVENQLWKSIHHYNVSKIGEQIKNWRYIKHHLQIGSDSFHPFHSLQLNFWRHFEASTVKNTLYLPLYLEWHQYKNICVCPILGTVSHFLKIKKKNHWKTPHK